jgi:cell filamentation protein
MSRQDRITLPQVTNLGKIASYAELSEHLIEAENKGRIWLFEKSKQQDNLYTFPIDIDILELHRIMFERLYNWAGQIRRDDKGPGGIVNVQWMQVRIELKQRFDNLKHRFDLKKSEVKLDFDIHTVAEIVAQAHHDFQYVHPFADTNGRTGRVLDHYLLWIAFNLVGDSLQTSPFIEHFPTEKHQDDYYDGLREADAGYLERLTQYYKERIEAAINAAEESAKQS